MARNNTAETDAREKSKKIGALSGLFPFLRPYKLMVAFSGFALVLTAVVSLVLPLAVRRVIDGFSENDTGLLDDYFVAALVLATLLAVGTGLRYYLVSRLGERVVADIRKAVFERVITLSPAFFERIMTGEILSRITTDTTVIQTVIGSSISVALRNVLLLIGGMLLMLFTSAKLTGLVLLIVPVVVVPIVVLGRRLRSLSRTNQDWIANSSGAASESLGAVQTVQSFTREATIIDGFNEVTEHAFVAAHRRIGTRAWMTGIVIFLIFSGIVGVLWIGARDVQTGAMSAGVLVQFLIYAILVAGAVGSLSEIWSDLQRAAGATERLVELLETADSVTDPAVPAQLPAPVKGELRFEDVAFAYPARPDHPALDHVSLTIKPGETVALVGPSGAGKTTIIQLLQRFYDPQGGAVLLDGVDLRDLARDQFRQQLSLVPQDPIIFANTALENIRFGRIDASDDEVKAAARAAAADDFIEALPQGYDTYLGERGVMLSGGQRQRIAIARAILRDAPVLLLDEATSALDAESERAVQQAVELMAAERTTVIVAHRLATVKKADRILVFENGQIVAEGSHDELVAQQGLYARLARLQFTDGAAG
ncbi:MAG: ABC transporter [Rhodobacterales bacterium]|nr:MAG: ABC transporter [Rhodobacterales bacterium]